MCLCYLHFLMNFNQNLTLEKIAVRKHGYLSFNCVFTFSKIYLYLYHISFDTIRGKNLKNFSANKEYRENKFVVYKQVVIVLNISIYLLNSSPFTFAPIVQNHQIFSQMYFQVRIRHVAKWWRINHSKTKIKTGAR